MQEGQIRLPFKSSADEGGRTLPERGAAGVNRHAERYDIEKIQWPIAFPEDFGSYFGREDEESAYLQSYQSTSSATLRLPITGLVQACQCPQLFKKYMKPDGKYEAYFYKSVDLMRIGSKVDKRARAYLAERLEHRSKKADELAEILTKDLEHIFKDRLGEDDPEFPVTGKGPAKSIEEIVHAFKNFCKVFKYAQYAHTVLGKTGHTVDVQIGNIQLYGSIDLLLVNSKENNYTLIDLKLAKYGRSLSEFSFVDMLQVLVYAYYLQRKVEIEVVGYYYLMESTLIYNRLSWITLSRLETVLQELVEALVRTAEYKPRECQLCQICPIKDACSIGQNLDSSKSKTRFMYFQY